MPEIGDKFQQTVAKAASCRAKNKGLALLEIEAV
jgi:hypothetical protein